MTNKGLYGDLPKLSSTSKERWLRFIGHVWRKTDETKQKFIAMGASVRKEEPRQTKIHAC